MKIASTVRFHLVAALPHCSFPVITLHWPPSVVKTLLFCENCICRHGTQRLPSSHRCLTTYFLPIIALSRSIRRCTNKPAPYSIRIFEAYAYLPNLHFAIHFPTTSVSSSFRMCEDFVGISDPYPPRSAARASVYLAPSLSSCRRMYMVFSVFLRLSLRTVYLYAAYMRGDTR